MPIPKLSTIKANVVAQNNVLKITVAAQEMQSPLVQLPFSKKSLYLGEPTLIKQIWEESILDKKESVFDPLFPKNILTQPEQLEAWAPLIGIMAQNDVLDRLVPVLNAAVDSNVQAWLNRKAPILKPTLDATLLGHEISFDTVFHFLFEQDKKLEVALRGWLQNILNYTQRAWKVSSYWPSWRRPFYFKAYRAVTPLLRQKIKNPTGYLKNVIEWNTSNKILSEHDLVDFLLFAFLSVQQSISNVLAAAFYELARNRGLALYLKNEIKAVAGSVPLQNSDYGKLLAAPMMADEILRLYPPVTLLQLKLKHQEILADTTVAKGTQMYASPFGIQRDERFWPTRNAFDPATSFDDPLRREGCFMPFGFLLGNVGMEVIVQTILTFAMSRVVQVADLALPLINKQPNLISYFGTKLEGDTAIRITAAHGEK